MNEERHPAASWDRRYRENDTPWDRGEASPALLGWLERGCLTGSRVLVPGCGSGHEVVVLAERGFEVTAVDFANSAIESLARRLRDRNLHADLYCADLLSWRSTVRFDAIYEQTSLCALAPGDWRAYADALADWLRPGGFLFALFMQTARAGGPPWHCDPVAMHRLFRAPAWTWVDEPDRTVPHPSGFHERPAVLRRGGEEAT